MNARYPLEGVKVVDLTQYVAGPYCTQVLADLGATVIKIERPGGDVYRRQGPVFLNGESISFLALNRGKRSVVLDLASLEDRVKLHALLAEADVLVENTRPGTLAKFGFDYPNLAEKYSALIYCSISAFGAEGPLAHAGGYDLTIQALSGLMAMNGHAEGDPAKIPVAALDFGSALYATVGILAALAQRASTGRGQCVEASILGCALAWLSMHALAYLTDGVEPTRLGTRSPFFAPYEAYKTMDGYLVVVGTGGTDAWGILCRTLKLERLLDDPRFATNGDRVRHAEELAMEIERVLVTMPSAHWVSVLGAADIPCAPVQTLSAALRSEAVSALEILGELEHPNAGRIPTMRLPLRLSRAKVTATQPPPSLGAHQDFAWSAEGSIGALDDSRGDFDG